jgi:hypothetical protein
MIRKLPPWLLGAAIIVGTVLLGLAILSALFRSAAAELGLGELGVGGLMLPFLGIVGALGGVFGGAIGRSVTGRADWMRPVTMWAVAAIVLAGMYAILLLRSGVLPAPAVLPTLALFVMPALAGTLLGEWMAGMG